MSAQSQPLRILGIDPGSRYTGWGIIDVAGQKQQCIDMGRIDARQGEMPQRLHTIVSGLAAVIAEQRPNEVAIEETFVNRVNAASALVLGQARGAAICAVAQAQLPMAEYAAAQVKLAVCGHGRADKLQVKQMVRVLLNLQGKLISDAADALAVALTHAQVRQTRRRAGQRLRAWG
ncbi:MAG: crossover junction endodeoxyribonuclease RuvC [Panacagrimonas sp.]